LAVGTVPRIQPVGRPGDLPRQIRSRRLAIPRLAKDAGAGNASLFGSVARGEDSTDSDLDELVDFPVEAKGALPLVRLRRQLSELLSRSVDVTTVDLLRPGIAAKALSEAVPL